ncbi:MAG: pur operon repressor [Clostridiaceae bacterium]|nr:pur operon repressor [Clostridiaceae bacterium]
MEKINRNERIALLMKCLTDSPGEIMNLGSFSEILSSAKSTISEDIDIVKNLLAKLDIGSIETIPGAQGGVRFVPGFSKEKSISILQKLCDKLSDSQRILPGGYLYMLDIIYDPKLVRDIASIFAGHFFHKGIDYVVTVETKGIPLAFAVAECLNIPLVIVRHNSEATDGPSVNTKYISGSAKKIQTMILSLRSLKRNSKVLFIDDFMKGGGTAKGIIELTKEFDCEVAGIGVLIETAKPSKKLIDKYISLLSLNVVDDNEKIIDIKPSVLYRANITQR